MTCFFIATIKLFVVLLIVLYLPSSMAAGSAVLRISCDGDDVGAEITINGSFRGECPVDIKVVPGKILLRVAKKPDKYSVRVFQQELLIADDTAKRIDVQLATEFTKLGIERQIKREADLKESKQREMEQREAEQRELARQKEEVLVKQVAEKKLQC